ncbi:hypothetical protein ACIQZG_03515 [Lysinibacillus sp. NPDC096418]
METTTFITNPKDRKKIGCQWQPISDCRQSRFFRLCLLFLN